MASQRSHRNEFAVVAFAVVALVALGLLLYLASAYYNQSVKGSPVNLSQELSNARSYGFRVTENMLAANSSAECSLQFIAPCDNNMPQQFICVNNYFVADISLQYKRIYANSFQECPLVLMLGRYSCGLENGYCIVLRQNYS